MTNKIIAALLALTAAACGTDNTISSVDRGRPVQKVPSCAEVLHKNGQPVEWCVDSADDVESSLQPLECQPESITCDGDTLQFCDAEGRIDAVEDCLGGCSMDGRAHCGRIAPR